jgi:hypothetical protein
MQRWGDLSLENLPDLPDAWSPGSPRLVSLICSCGRNTTLPFDRLTRTAPSSCGKCSYQSKEFWLAQKWGKIQLDPSQDHLPEEWAKGYNGSFYFICDCNLQQKLLRKFEIVSRGEIRSCGCIQTGRDRLHSPAGEIYQWLVSLGVNAEWEYKIPGSRKSYDIYLPDHKVAIEYHGLRWHSEKFCSTPRDHQKYLKALSDRIRLLQIYQDEWKDSPESLKGLILGACNLKQTRDRIRPEYEVRGSISTIAQDLLDQHHYLGRSGGSLVVEARHKDQIVGVWVFKKVSSTRVEWLRACWHRNYKAWNPHSKALQLAIPELQKMGFTEIVSFSDNRLHTGHLYEYLGFELDGHVPSRYDYTDGHTRRHRSKFMVPAGIDERATAAAAGWYRIWDSGKKRWLLAISNVG